MKLILILFGPPGSGKGTQAEIIAKKLNLPSISPGELLRQEKQAGSEIGKKAKEYMDKGALVPDELVEEIIATRLKQDDARNGFILDGYPRNASQLNILTEKIIAAEDGMDDSLAIVVDVSDKQVEERLGGRRVCACGEIYHLIYNPPVKEGVCDKCGGALYIRADDKVEVIKQRLQIYHKEADPLLAWWEKKGKLIRIDGGQDIAKVSDDIIKELHKRGL